MSRSDNTNPLDIKVADLQGVPTTGLTLTELGEELDWSLHITRDARRLGTGAIAGLPRAMRKQRHRQGRRRAMRYCALARRAGLDLEAHDDNDLLPTYGDGKRTVRANLR